MSAFLMSEESVSDLAYNLFTRGAAYDMLADYFDHKNMTCPEDLFNELRWENMQSMNARYDDMHYTKKDIGDYHFRKNKLSDIELIKKIQCWKYQSCESDKVFKGKLFKALCEFVKDLSVRYVEGTEEYRNAEWR